MKTYLSWDYVEESTESLAQTLVTDYSDKLNDFVILAPYYGGWPVATMTVNAIRNLTSTEFKPPAINETDLIRLNLLSLFNSQRYLVIFDDVLDTGKVINNIIWRIDHECRSFINTDKIHERIIVATIGRKRKCEWPCRHIFNTEWKLDEWIVFPWE